jgi:hypothetical protein
VKRTYIEKLLFIHAGLSSLKLTKIIRMLLVSNQLTDVEREEVFVGSETKSTYTDETAIPQKGKYKDATL